MIRLCMPYFLFYPLARLAGLSEVIRSAPGPVKGLRSASRTADAALDRPGASRILGHQAGKVDLPLNPGG